MADNQQQQQAQQHPLTDARNDTYITARYRIGKQLGEGAYGVVYDGIDLSTKKEVAIKAIAKGRKGVDDVKVANEVMIMRALDHPRILRVMEAFQTENFFVVVLEKVLGGALLQHLLKVQKYTERKACRVIFNLLRAIRYMHDKEIMHCDIKPDNLLLVKVPINDEEVSSIKLADFGLARVCKPGHMPTSCRGSPMYMAPEVILSGIYRRVSHYDTKADMWSVGIIAYLLVSGMVPFYAPNVEDIFKLSLNVGHSFDHPAWEPVSPQARHFVDWLLTKDPARRPSAAEALTHPWMELMANPDEEDDTDLPQTLERLKEFNAQQKFRGAVLGVEALLKMGYAAMLEESKMKANSALMRSLSVVPITRIDLSNNYLGIRGLNKLCDALTQHPSVRELNVSNCLVDDEQLDRLMPFFLRRTSVLEHLVFDSNELTHMGGRVLLSLAASRPAVKYISASHNHIKDTILARITEQCMHNRSRAVVPTGDELL